MNQNLFPCLLWTVGLFSSATLIAGGPAHQPATMQPPMALMASATGDLVDDAAIDYPAPGYTCGDMQSPCLSPAPTKFATIKTEIISAIQGVIDNSNDTTADSIDDTITADSTADSIDPGVVPQYEVPQFETPRSTDASDDVVESASDESASDESANSESTTDEETLPDAEIWNDAERGETPDRQDVAPLGDVTQSEFGSETADAGEEPTTEPSDEASTAETGEQQSIGDSTNLEDTDAPSARFSGGIIALPEYPVNGPDSEDQVDGTTFRALENVIQQTFDNLLFPSVK